MKIGLLYTGGTIGCSGTPLTPLNENEFKEAFLQHLSPIIESQYPDCETGFIPFGTSLDSTNLQPGDWCKIAGHILEQYENYDAFIVLHGTDTMAWTASALSFLFTGLDKEGRPNAVLSKPVIVTGSQLPLFHKKTLPGSKQTETKKQKKFSILFNTDAFQNVCGAFASAYSGIPEVALYFNDTLYRGNRTAKTNANEFNAFSSPNYPPVGKYGVAFDLINQNILPLPTTKTISLDSPGVLELLKKQLKHISEKIELLSIVSFPSFPFHYQTVQGDQAQTTNILDQMLKSCLSYGVNGIILESYGEGNFPSGNPEKPQQGTIFQTLHKAHTGGVIIVDCTQVLTGVVNSQAYASGSWLSVVGAISAYDMTPIAALSKLFYLSALRSYEDYNWHQTFVERLMQTGICGEIMDIDRLDSRGQLFLAAGESITALDGTATLVNDFKAGPVLLQKKTDGSTVTLWKAVQEPPGEGLPGQLYMQANGNLVFHDQSHTVLYESGTTSPEMATSRLVLEGFKSKTGAKLYIYNYAKNETTAVLYSVVPLPA